MNEQQFNTLKKNSAKSFNDQKALIKKVLAGRDIKCRQCGTTIKAHLPESTISKAPKNKAPKGKVPENKKSEDKKVTGLYCAKGCTNIALDFVL